MPQIGITLKEFSELHTSEYVGYLTDLSEGSQVAGLFAWNPNELNSWGQLFDGNRVFYRIRDRRLIAIHPLPLRTIEQTLTAVEAGVRQNMVNYPDRLWIGDMRLSEAQVAEMTAAMTPFGASNLQELVDRALEFARKGIRRTPTVEYPVKIEICDADHEYWSFCVESQEVAEQVLTKLVADPSFSNLEKLGFTSSTLYD